MRLKLQGEMLPAVAVFLKLEAPPEEACAAAVGLLDNVPGDVLKDVPKEDSASGEVVKLRNELAAARRRIAALQEMHGTSQVAMEAMGTMAPDLAVVLTTASPAATGIRAARKNLGALYSTTVLHRQQGGRCASPTRGALELGKTLRGEIVPSKEGLGVPSTRSCSNAMSLPLMDTEGKSSVIMGGAEALEPLEVARVRERSARAKNRAVQVVTQVRAERAEAAKATNGIASTTAATTTVEATLACQQVPTKQGVPSPLGKTLEWQEEAMYSALPLARTAKRLGEAIDMEPFCQSSRQSAKQLVLSEAFAVVAPSRLTPSKDGHTRQPQTTPSCWKRRRMWPK